MILAQSWVGTLPTWLTLAAVIGGAWIFVRGGGGTALTTLQVANQILEKRVHILEGQAVSDAKLIAELKARTDLAAQFQPLLAWTGEHEARDQERFERTLKAMEEIAAELKRLDLSTKGKP